MTPQIKVNNAIKCIVDLLSTVKFSTLIKPLSNWVIGCLGAVESNDLE